MTEFIWWTLALVAAIWLIEIFFLRGENLSAFDSPQPTPRDARETSDEHKVIFDKLGEIPAMLKGMPMSSHVPVLRKHMDTLFGADDSGAQIIPVSAAGATGVPAEWVIHPGVDTQRRLLYIHGGAFTMGSPLSHRRLTSKFSEMADAAVLAIDYRLMPEHPRLAGIEDCRAAYTWMLDNGPNSSAPASAVFIAGDSAGGNLTLSLINWIRDQGLRTPNAAVALSPATDSTMGSPTLKAHVETDPMLGPLFKKLTKVPRSVLLWIGLFTNRMRPCDPRISPIYADLSRLPPVLVHASHTEMLRDDAIRYVNRAVAAGSPVHIQTWNHSVHVWHIFHPQLAEGREAMEEIRKFLRANS